MSSFETLDEPKKKPKKHVNYLRPLYVVLAVFFTGMVMRYLKVPGGVILIFITMPMLAAYAAGFLVFFQKNDWITNGAMLVCVFFLTKFFYQYFGHDDFLIYGAINFVVSLLLFIFFIGRKL